MEMINLITCKKCNTEKQTSEFPSDKTRPTGLHPYCKPCKSGDQRAREKAKTEQRYTLDDEANYRICDTCGEKKHRSAYHSSRFGRKNAHVKCQACIQAKRLANPRKPRKDRTAIHRNEIKEYLIKISGGKCTRCDLMPSERFPISCFDFHHVDSKTKSFNISHNLNKFSTNPEILIEEVKKCVLLCANCHRAIHFK